MNKRNMGVILLIVGAALMVGGIIIVSTKGNSANENKSEQTHAQVDTVKTNMQRPASDFASNALSNPQPGGQTGEAVDQSKAKGDAFEDYVVNLLADWRLKLLERTQDAVSSAGVVAESCKNPDLHVEQKRGNSEIDYYLECKYRSKWDDNGEIRFEDWQLDRYRQFQRDHHRKVLIALGVGGNSSAPETFMIVPIDSIKVNTIKKIKTQYRVSAISSALIEYMNDYFTTVFDKAKERKANKKN